MDIIKTLLSYHQLIQIPQEDDERVEIRQETILLKDARVSEHPILLKVSIQLNDTYLSSDSHDIDIPALMFRSLDDRTWYEKVTNDKSDSEESSFYPFTCSCGEPGCAGIWNGIRVKNRRKTVEWRASKADGYKFLDKQFYVFDKEQYLRETAGLFDKIQTVQSVVRAPVYIELSHSGEGVTLSEATKLFKRRDALTANPEYIKFWKARMRRQR